MLNHVHRKVFTRTVWSYVQHYTARDACFLSVVPFSYLWRGLGLGYVSVAGALSVAEVWVYGLGLHVHSPIHPGSSWPRALSHTHTLVLGKCDYDFAHDSHCLVVLAYGGLLSVDVGTEVSG